MQRFTKQKPMDNKEYGILWRLAGGRRRPARDFTIVFLSQESLEKREASAKAKLEYLENKGLIRQQTTGDSAEITYELTEEGALRLNEEGLKRGIKYPIGILEGLPESGWIDVDNELPKVGEPVQVAVKVGGISPHILIKADELQKRGRFSCEMDWVSVLYWKPFDK